VPLDEKEPAFGCTVPAGDLRVNSWASEHPDVHVFNFIGVPPTNADGIPAQAEKISVELAAHLRSVDCDWYVPDKLEFFEEAGILGERSLDRDALVSILTPQWLAWFASEERAAGIELLWSIVDVWLTEARRTADPIAAVKRRKAELLGWSLYVAPGSRLRVLASYAVHTQLSMIEEELARLKAMTATERAAVHNLTDRFAEWREAVVALTAAVRETHADSIRQQHADVLAAIDELTGN
jgi:hypothetical protein